MFYSDIYQNVLCVKGVSLKLFSVIVLMLLFKFDSIFLLSQGLNAAMFDILGLR